MLTKTINKISKLNYVSRKCFSKNKICLSKSLSNIRDKEVWETDGLEKKLEGWPGTGGRPSDPKSYR